MAEANTETPTDTAGTATPDKPTVLQSMGGPLGLVYAGIPSVAFAIVNGIAGLYAAIAVAVGAGAGITMLRLLRNESLQPALSGLLGVAVSALIAFQTGEARNYFLIGIWMSLLLAVVFLISVVVRRPLVGVLWTVVTGKNQGWRANRTSLRAFDIATLVFVAVFASRFVVQQWLYVADSTGWLAFTRIATGYPVLALAVLVSWWAIRRSAGAQRRGA